MLQKSLVHNLIRHFLNHVKFISVLPYTMRLSREFWSLFSPKIDADPQFSRNHHFHRYFTIWSLIQFNEFLGNFYWKIWILITFRMLNKIVSSRIDIFNLSISLDIDTVFKYRNIPIINIYGSNFWFSNVSLKISFEPWNHR